MLCVSAQYLCSEFVLILCDRVRACALACGVLLIRAIACVFEKGVHIWKEAGEAVGAGQTDGDSV